MPPSFSPNTDPPCGETLEVGHEDFPGFGIWNVDVAVDPAYDDITTYPIELRILMYDADFKSVRGERYEWDGKWLTFADDFVDTDLGVIQGAGDFLYIPLSHGVRDYTIQARQKTGSGYTAIVECTITADIEDVAYISADRLRIWAKD